MKELFWQRITISLLTDRRMWRAGSDAPMIQMHIAAIAAVSTVEQNEVHAPKLSHFLQEKTNLPMNRWIVIFLIVLLEIKIYFFY